MLPIFLSRLIRLPIVSVNESIIWYSKFFLRRIATPLEFVLDPAIMQSPFQILFNRFVSHSVQCVSCRQKTDAFKFLR